VQATRWRCTTRGPFLKGDSYLVLVHAIQRDGAEAVLLGTYRSGTRTVKNLVRLRSGRGREFFLSWHLISF